MSEPQVETTLNKGKELYALLMLEINQTDFKSALHQKIKAFTSKIQDMFPKDLSSSLSLISGISTKLTVFPVPHDPTKLPIDVMLKRLKNYIGRLKNYRQKPCEGKHESLFGFSSFSSIGG